MQVQAPAREVVRQRSLELRVGRVLTVANAVAVGELRDEAALGRALHERVEAVEREQIGVERVLEAKRGVHGYLSGRVGRCGGGRSAPDR